MNNTPVCIDVDYLIPAHRIYCVRKQGTDTVVTTITHEGKLFDHYSALPFKNVYDAWYISTMPRS
jgi:hypothetical protein